MNRRLDSEVVKRRIVLTRSQAESYIKLGLVLVNGKVKTKAGFFVNENDDIKLLQKEQYVSRAGLKLASVAQIFGLDFKDKIVLDVGSSTGGFTDYALKQGAKKVIAVDVGTKQLHPSLVGNPRVELYEQTNILDVGRWTVDGGETQELDGGHWTLDVGESQKAKLKVYVKDKIDIVLADVSFVSLRELLPHIATLCSKNSQIVAMVKPQFEAGENLKNKGVIKNDTIRRQILKDFETWARQQFVIINKADSTVAGAKGNLERFYILKKL